jgi:hypothetical protein
MSKNYQFPKGIAVKDHCAMRCALIKKEQGFGRFALCSMLYAFIRPLPHAFKNVKIQGLTP